MLQDADVRVEHVEGRLRIGFGDRLQGVRLVPVIGIDDPDDVARRHPDPLVHGVVDAVVLFADDPVAVVFVGERLPVFIDNFNGIVLGGAVDDDVFHVIVCLVQDRFNRVPDRLFTIEANGNNAYQHIL